MIDWFLLLSIDGGHSLVSSLYSLFSLSYSHPCGQFFALLKQGVPVHADVCGHIREGSSDGGEEEQ